RRASAALCRRGEYRAPLGDRLLPCALCDIRAPAEGGPDMTTVLVAKFEKRYSSEIAIEADWLRPADQFSITVLFGPSGCGKTTVLRGMAGLERPEHGLIQFGDRVWFKSSRRIMLTPQQRDIGFLFQDYVLFPHLSVGDNIAYGIRGLPRVDQKRQVAEILR